MGALQLSLIMSANDRSSPVLDGSIQPDGIDLICTTAHPSEIFWRQLHFQEFDVSEMSLSSLLMAVALLYLTSNNLVDRSRVDLEGNPAFHLLFPDPIAEGQRYYRKTGIFPINHGMVVRRSTYEQHPWVTLNLFNAFRQAKEKVAARTRELVSTHLELGLLGPDAGQALRVDPYPYGVRSNQKVLETVAQYSYKQGLTPRLMRMDEIFAPSTLDL